MLKVSFPAILGVTNRPSFCLILKLSYPLDDLFSVLSRLHGCKHKCTFCRMKHLWTCCHYFQILLLGILWRVVTTFRYCCLGFFLAWNAVFIFRYRYCNGHFPGFGKYIFSQRQTSTALILSADCTEWSCSPNIVIFNNFLAFSFSFFNFKQ